MHSISVNKTRGFQMLRGPFLASHVFIGDFYFVIIIVRGRIADPPPILPDFVAILFLFLFLFFLYMNHAISHQNNDKNIDLDQFVLT